MMQITQITVELDHILTEAVLAVYHALVGSRWTPRELISEVSASSSKERLVYFGSPSRIERLHLLCLGKPTNWRITATGTQDQIEEFAHLLCGICGTDQEVVAGEMGLLTAEKTTLLLKFRRLLGEE